MKKFSTWLMQEAISASATDAVNKIVKSYLQKKLGGKVYRMPGVEQFINSTGRGYGVRYFYDGDKSVRFNWKGANITSFTLDSVDIWDGTKKDPNWHMSFDSQMSLVKVLPTVIDFCKNKFGQGTFYAIPPDDLQQEETETSLHLVEAAKSEQDAFDLLIDELAPGKQLPVAALEVKYGWRVSKVLTYLRATAPFSHKFEKQGRGVVYTGTADDIKALVAKKDDVMHGLGAVKVTVSSGGTKESYLPSDQEKEMESVGLERLAYEEQLKDLESLMKLIIKGRSNALFVAGRGGTGKTQTVETELAKAGLQDGEGYFKNTGSASPYGIYSSLFRNRKGIILFDDCDSALADQEGRNLIKAATDTKKSRKIAWNKKSSIMIPEKDYIELSDDYSRDVHDDKGNQLYPASFEFLGRIIFISNLKLDKLDPDKALRTRGYIIEIDPTDAEMIDYMAKIAKKITLESGKVLSQSEIDEVINEIRNSKNKSDISLRKLVRGLNIKDEMGDDPNWKRILQRYA
jgi:hypothetical protein